jgi:propanol-preferring alcohol dehydrogenase
VILKGIRIAGSFLGTRDDLESVFRLGAQGTVAPTEVFELGEVPHILSRLQAGQIAGRAVISF